MARGTERSDWTVAWSPGLYKHLPYDQPAYRGHKTEYWPADHTFEGELRVVGHEKGRSSVTVQWQDHSGFEFSMFFAEFMRLVEIMDKGHVRGKWGFQKNGSNTGLICLAA